MLKHDEFCVRSERSRNGPTNLLFHDGCLLSFDLDDIAAKFRLVLGALRIALARRFCFDSARNRIASRNVIGEIDFDRALRCVEGRDKESVRGVGADMIANLIAGLLRWRRRCSWSWRGCRRWQRYMDLERSWRGCRRWQRYMDLERSWRGCRR